MPTDKPRITFTLDEETLKAVDDYKFKHRIKNQSQAILSLIEIGLESITNSTNENEKSSAPEGLEEKVDMKESDDLFDDMIRTGLVENNSKLTEADTAFFKSVVAMIETWKANKCG